MNHIGNSGHEGPSGSSGGDAFTVKRIMGRTPGLIKSKFLSVLDSSNGILNGISSKVNNTRRVSYNALQSMRDSLNRGWLLHSLSVCPIRIYLVGGVQFEFVDDGG